MTNKPKKTQDQYAAEYKVSPRTIRNWAARGYPLDDPAKVAEFEAAQKHSKKLKTEIAAVKVAPSITSEELRNPPTLACAMVYERILRCRKLAQDVREMEAKIMHRDEVDAGTRRVKAGVKSLLLGLPAILPAQLVGLPEHGIQKQLSIWVHATLTELSNPQSPVYQP